MTVFALDIGTHKIAGLLMSRTEGGFLVEHTSLHPQLPQAMADGQIHDITAVAEVIQKTKTELEQKSGLSLKRAAVAAAGRSLITRLGTSKQALLPNQRLSAQEVKTLELEAVWSAIQGLGEGQGQGVLDSYLCVGYSTVQYYLDQEPIGSLIGHQGGEAQVCILATFLPRIVIDSLNAALETAQLEMASLTLEPIAAMHLVVPATMRLLNIALVDLGAGTSDLAISAQGTVKAYGMVSRAGDLITKKIAHHFLLDWSVAEMVKLSLQPSKIIECQDVFGNDLALSYAQILEVIYPAVKQLAEKIAQEILRLNEGPPKGVILIGGGSLTPDLAPLLAEALQLPEHLVRVRLGSDLKTIAGVGELGGPQIITPLGIGCAFLEGLAMELIHVRVNGQRRQLLKMASTTVGDALLNSGFTPADLVGRPGPAYTVELNDRYVLIPGSMGQAASILRNGQPVEIGAPLKEGDQITVTLNAPGKSPRITLSEFTDAPAHTFQITLNDSPLKVEPLFTVNGRPQAGDYLIQDRDRINLRLITNFLELFAHLRIPLRQEVPYYLNGKKTSVPEKIEILIEGEKKPLNTPLKNGQRVQYYRSQRTIGEICPARQNVGGIAVTINGEPFLLAPKEGFPLVNGQPATWDQVLRPNDRLAYHAPLGDSFNSYILTDIFRDYTPEEAFLKKGGRIFVNGREAGFTTPIKQGDSIELIP